RQAHSNRRNRPSAALGTRAIAQGIARWLGAEQAPRARIPAVARRAVILPPAHPAVRAMEERQPRSKDKALPAELVKTKATLLHADLAALRVSSDRARARAPRRNRTEQHR